MKVEKSAFLFFMIIRNLHKKEIPHKRTHKARTYACSFSVTRKLRELKVAE
jgi:hypothetical protein